MQTRALASLVLLASSVLTGTTPRKDATGLFEESLDGVIAQFVDGGAWQTTITLLNIDTTLCNYQIKFFAEDGSPLTVQTSDGTANVLNGSIPAGGSHRIISLDVKPLTSVGWALVHTSNITGGNATFRQRVVGRPDFEASMPIVFYLENTDYVVPFDNTNSSTGIGLVNPVSFQTITLFLTFRDETGNRIFLDSIDLGPMQHTSFDLATRFAPSAGVRGTVEIATTGFAVDVLALHFLGAAFSSVIPLEK